MNNYTKDKSQSMWKIKIKIKTNFYNEYCINLEWK